MRGLVQHLAFAISTIAFIPPCCAQGQVTPNSENTVACADSLEQPPITPYGFAKATLISLWHARNAARTGNDIKNETADATTYFALMTAMMRVTKIATNDFICAKRIVRPFNGKENGETFQPAARFLLMVYDEHININNQLLEVLKKMDTTPQSEVMDKFSTLQVERGQRWADLVQPVTVALMSLIDANHTDKNGNVDRLVVTKKQRQELLSWANEHFPEFKDGTPKDTWTDPAKTAELYLVFFNTRKCSDE